MVTAAPSGMRPPTEYVAAVIQVAPDVLAAWICRLPWPKLARVMAVDQAGAPCASRTTIWLVDGWAIGCVVTRMVTGMALLSAAKLRSEEHTSELQSLRHP